MPKPTVDDIREAFPELGEPDFYMVETPRNFDEGPFSTLHDAREFCRRMKARQRKTPFEEYFIITAYFKVNVEQV